MLALIDGKLAELREACERSLWHDRETAQIEVLEWLRGEYVGRVHAEVRSLCRGRAVCSSCREVVSDWREVSSQALGFGESDGWFGPRMRVVCESCFARDGSSFGGEEE